MAGQFFPGNTVQVLPQNCLVDLTPPTFSGVSGVFPKNNGAVQLSWGAASDATEPITFLIYVSLGNVDAATLYQSQNLGAIAPEGSLSWFLFSLGVASWPNANSPIYFIKDQEYTFGVRAKDGAGNIDTNTVVMTATAIGSVDLATIFQTLQTQFTQDHANFVDDHNLYDQENTQLGNNVNDLGNLVDGLEAAANALTASDLQGEIVTDDVLDGSV